MDYDVAALALSQPPAEASLTTYRPTIQVRNNGRYPAIAYGDLQAYKAGRRVWFSHVESAAIAPGETGNATAADDWEPDTEGDYTFFGYVSCHLDQVETNNQLAPVTIHVGPEPPTPPPAVPPHAQQHEHGGSDAIDVDQLAGKLRDEQTPEAHAARHQAAGDDQLNVAGLAGVLGDPQVPTNHGNEHHNPDFASSAELANHANATVVHSAATNLASRELSGTRVGLVPQAQLATGSEVPDPDQDYHLFGLRLDDSWGPTEPKRHHTAHEPGGADPITFPEGNIPVGMICVWNGNVLPYPPGWQPVSVNPPLTIPYVYLQRTS